MTATKLLFLAALCLAGCDSIETARHVKAIGDEQQLVTALKAFQSEYGQLPSGKSGEIFDALRGNNPKKIVFVEYDASSTSSRGEFLDPWGTPYRVYVSADTVLIRSAGPNKVFDAGTATDDYFAP